MIQFQKELEEESNSSSDEENEEEEKKNEEGSVTSSEKEIGGRSLKLKKIMEKMNANQKETDPIKFGAFKQLKKEIARRLRSFNYRIFSNSLYRFFSKHVFILFLFSFLNITSLE